MRPTSLSYGLTILYCDKSFFFPSLPLYALKDFLYFWFSEIIISNCMLTQAFSENAVSGTQIFSTCGRVFSCLLLKSKTSCQESLCDMKKNKNLHILQNPCIMHRLIYTHAHTHTYTYKEPCVPQYSRWPSLFDI